MKQFTYLLASCITLAGLSGCGGGGDTATIDPGTALAKPDQVPLLIKNLESIDTTANSFAISECKILGPEAEEALPALRELRTRRAADANVVAKIDEAIASIEGGPAAATP